MVNFPSRFGARNRELTRQTVPKIARERDTQFDIFFLSRKCVFFFSSSCFLHPPPLAKARKESAEATSLSRKRGKRKEFPSYSIVSTEGGREECNFFDPWPFFRGRGTEGRSSHLSSPSEKRGGGGGEKIKSSFIYLFFMSNRSAFNKPALKSWQITGGRKGKRNVCVTFAPLKKEERSHKRFLYFQSPISWLVDLRGKERGDFFWLRGNKGLSLSLSPLPFRQQPTHDKDEGISQLKSARRRSNPPLLIPQPNCKKVMLPQKNAPTN